MQIDFGKYHASAKGVVVKDNKILLIEYDEEGVGVHYNLPGGRIYPNETAHEALHRKMLEEAGAKVIIKNLLFVYEYIGQNHKYEGGDKHSISIVFLCELQPNSYPNFADATNTDNIQIDVKWIDFDSFLHVKFWPNVADKILNRLKNMENESDIYWGDIF